MRNALILALTIHFSSFAVSCARCDTAHGGCSPIDCGISICGTDGNRYLENCGWESRPAGVEEADQPICGTDGMIYADTCAFAIRPAGVAAAAMATCCALPENAALGACQ